MKKPLLFLLCLCLCLFCFAMSPAFALEASRASANGSDECPPTMAEAHGSTPAKSAAPAAKPAPPSPAKSADGNALPRLSQPRWHSLLPGMFK